MLAVSVIDGAVGTQGRVSRWSPGGGGGGGDKRAVVLETPGPATTAFGRVVSASPLCRVPTPSTMAANAFGGSREEQRPRQPTGRPQEHRPEAAAPPGLPKSQFLRQGIAKGV